MNIFDLGELMQLAGIAAEQPAAPQEQKPAPQAEQKPAEQNGGDLLPEVTAKIAELKIKYPGFTFGVEKYRCIYISGETKQHKDELKADGAKWAPKRKQWLIYVPNPQQKPTPGKEEIEAALKEKIEELKKLDGLRISLVGCWLWIDGNTQQHKDELKKAGCCWSKSKNKWSFHLGGYYKRGRERKYKEITDKYGEQEIL